jgi:hypothetical protein
MSRYPTKLGFILSNRLSEAYVTPSPPHVVSLKQPVSLKLVCDEVVYFLIHEASKYTKLEAVSHSQATRNKQRGTLRKTGYIP